MEQTVAEYFAGIGLMRMGLEAAGWRVAFANDFSQKKFEMYQAFYPDAEQHYLIEDIFNLDPAGISTTTLATCSFPCIDLSLAGNMSGVNKGKHSSAFWGFIKVLKGQGQSAPPLVLAENVPGWLHSNKGADFRATVQALNELGYACDVFTLDALRFTPQSRLRVFLVGVKAPLSNPGVSAILSRPTSLLPDALRKSLLANIDLKFFYTSLPQPPSLRTEGLTEIVETLPEDDLRWWPQEQVDYHLAMMEPSHLERVHKLAQGEHTSYRTFYRRKRGEHTRAEVRSDDLAGCLRTAVGGSGKQFLIEAGKGKIRMRVMTPREYARLQGVSDNFPIRVNGVQALTGFGDAVCAPAITWIAQYAINPLAENLRATTARS